MSGACKFPFLGALVLNASRKPGPAAPGVEKRLAMLELLVHSLVKKDSEMRHEVEDLVAEVAGIKTVIDAVIIDHASLIEQINAAIGASDFSTVAAAVVDLRT